MSDWKEIVGRNIKRRRVEAKLTQEQLAFGASIDLTYNGGIERGRRNPSLLILVRIADALDTEPASLLRPEEASEPPSAQT